MKIRILLPLTLILFTSCFKEHKIGQITVNGIENIYMNIYQEDEFDFVTALKYEITDSKKNIILVKPQLIGTEDNVTHLKDFKAKSIDSIVYLTWGNENEIYAVYDFKSGKGYPKGKLKETWKAELENGNKLMSRLKVINPNLNANWNN